MAAVEARIAAAQSEIVEAVEAAQEVAAYEPEEDETVNAAVMKKALQTLIADMKDSKGESAATELKKLQNRQDALTAIEKRIRDGKAELKSLADTLGRKLQLKRLGPDDLTAETKDLLAQNQERLASLDPGKKDEKKTIAALRKDNAALEARLAETDALLSEIGGQLTDEEARTLILQKLYDLALRELNRYVNAEKRAVVAAVENLWDKYALSSLLLEADKQKTAGALNEYLTGLGYLP
jgi:type I restriction enzyme M protein